jgi:hypothetical protein
MSDKNVGNGKPLEDLTGQRFGKRIVLAFHHRERRPGYNTVIYWTVRCDCGTVSEVNTGNLKRQ